ncbi:MAG: pilus assembly protein TadG-related protein [Myxococcota bacterium]
MRRRRIKQRGQAALLAVIGLVILAIGMYTSYNLSRSVYEKIQLQNAADATAYSLATLEARTFNFIAFANRAQVANYVQMMEAQSILSSATFVEGLTAWGGDYAQALGRFLKLIAKLPGFGWLYEVGDTLFWLGDALEKTYDNAFKPMVQTMEDWTPRFIQMQTVENQALFAVSGMMALTTAIQLGGGGGDIARQNDPDARLTWMSYALNALNVVSYGMAYDPASLSMSGSDDKTQKAKRLITEMAQAARVGSTPGKEPFIVSRPPGDTLTLLLTSMKGNSGHGGNSGRRAQRLMQPFITALDALIPNFVGTTKLLTSDASGRLPDLADTGRRSPEYSGLARGESIAAKDTTKPGSASIFPPWGNFASVISTPSKGQHCRYKKKPDGYGQIARLGQLWNGGEFECKDESRHVWKALIGRGGVQPYLKFAAKKEGFSAERTSFNQPDVWVFLNKKPSKMGMQGIEDLDFEYRQGAERARLDARIGKDGVLQSGLFDGMNSLARAQVYYHRPGAWQEPPNFFNPFWGARLAPKNVAIKRLTSELGLGAAASQLFADNVWMH